MSLIIYTESPKLNIFYLETYKKLGRKIFKKNRGPQAVTASVIRGLNALNYDYKINPSIQTIKPNDIIWINESIDAVRWAITFKQKNKDRTLVVGPNIVVMPNDVDGIMFNPAINIILQPSEWTKKLYEQYRHDIVPKICVWPAGVENPYPQIQDFKKENYIIVYQKNAPPEILETTLQLLKTKHTDFKIITYGSFQHADFLSLLEKACGMIYLSTSESQGIALQEAWIRDVPTLVWDRGFWEHKGVKFEYEHISCPYLTSESGITFKDINDVNQQLTIFMESLPHFKAREYCLKNLTDEVTTAKYIDIITT